MNNFEFAVCVLSPPLIWLFGYIMGRADSSPPADLDAAARAFWVEAEKAHAAKHAERNPPA